MVKRHIVTDTIGIPLGVKVTDANVSDNRVAIELLKEVFSWQITIQLVCADAGYRGKLGDWLYLTHQCQLDIAPSLGGPGFVVVPFRWIVERTFSWLLAISAILTLAARGFSCCTDYLAPRYKRDTDLSSTAFRNKRCDKI